MHRPTRKHTHLKAKLERKASESRRVGKKARRWKKWLSTYESLCQSN